MTDQLEITLPDAGPFPGEDDPKALRHWLFAHFVAALNDEADRAEPDTRPTNMAVPAPAGPIVTYYEARAKAMALRQAARAAQRLMATREERLVQDRANYGQTPSETELECARHHDRCAVCMVHEDAVQRVVDESDRLERVRVIFVQGVGDVLAALQGHREAVGRGDESTLTLTKIEKALRRTSAAAHTRWQKRSAK